MDQILRLGTLLTFPFLESMVFPDLTDNSFQGVSVEFLENQRKKMLHLIKLLELDKLETVEEIRRELYVDFSTLPPGFSGDRKMDAKALLNVFEGQIHESNLLEATNILHLSDLAKYNLQKFNIGIRALGVNNFMMAAAQFCEEEAAGGAIDIVSVGSGDGTIERFIMTEYRSRYGKDLPRIKLVDPDPAFDGIVDFKTVDHLIEERPNMVGNCVAFIIWPLYDDEEVGAYDIEAVRKLQPKAVFVVCETGTGSSGSNDFRSLLRDEKLETLSPDDFGSRNWLNRLPFHEEKNHGLDNYEIIEIAHQKIFLPHSGTYIFRMVKLKRDVSEHDSSDL